MLNEEEHAKATMMRNIIGRLIEEDIREKNIVYNTEIEADLYMLCDSISHDGEELVLVFPDKPRVVRVRVDYVDASYVEETKARMEATDGMEDLEDFLRENGNGSSN